MSDMGPEGFTKFPPAKYLAAWLRLAPNDKVSDGRIISSLVPRRSCRLKAALRNTYFAIGRQKEGHLNKFYRKIAFKKGSTKAIKTTARKLAKKTWNMVGSIVGMVLKTACVVSEKPDDHAGAPSLPHGGKAKNDVKKKI